MTSAASVLRDLRSRANSSARAGMARVGILGKAYGGTSMPELRRMGKRLGRDHALARALVADGAHESLVLASLVGDSARITRAEAERWLARCGSWASVDAMTLNLLKDAPFARAAALAWSRAEPVPLKRSAFSLMAVLAVHADDADARFAPFLKAVEREARDDRNDVRKAVSWALRQTGKRSPALKREAMAVARRLAASDDRAERWVGKDALRDLRR